MMEVMELTMEVMSFNGTMLDVFVYAQALLSFILLHDLLLAYIRL
jgi:hypothetical protein